MSKRHETYNICDICGRKNAETWLVGNPQGERAKVDLCPRCDDPVRKAWVAGRRNPQAPTGMDTVPAVDDYVPSSQSETGQVHHWAEAQEKRRG